MQRIGCHLRAVVHIFRYQYQCHTDPNNNNDNNKGIKCTNDKHKMKMTSARSVVLLLYAPAELARTEASPLFSHDAQAPSTSPSFLLP